MSTEVLNAEVKIQDLATPKLDALLRQTKRPKGMLTVVGRRVENVLRDYFLQRNEEGNKQGWPRSNFWSQTVAAATRFEGATDTEATVRIASREFLHKLEGGTIRAKNGRMLARPSASKAPREILHAVPRSGVEAGEPQPQQNPRPAGSNNRALCKKAKLHPSRAAISRVACSIPTKSARETME